jgi:ABC-type transport system involved in cytochrome bd biosynthesis fused ATPase/permease subunit
VIHGESFEGTYLDNITFNDKDNTQEDLKWALDGVQLGSFIKSYHKA